MLSGKTTGMVSTPMARIDFRLIGKTDGGRTIIMDGTVYARSQKDFINQVKERATEGPWYYKGTAEPVPETERVTVEHAERLSPRKSNT